MTASDILRPQRDAAWYDESWRQLLTTPSDYNTGDPDGSRYAPVWRHILSRIGREERILDLGCGPGLFAQMAAQEGKYYGLGLDFSSVAISEARRRVPQAIFCRTNLTFNPGRWMHGHDVVVCCEVLEHIEDDLALLRAVPAGMHVLLSVPSFDWEGHVRYYTTLEAWEDHFAGDLDVAWTAEVPQPPHGKIWVMEGRRC